MLAGLQLSGVGGTTWVVPAGGGRRRVAIKRSKFADDEDVERENDERNDEENGQLGHPRPD